MGVNQLGLAGYFNLCHFSSLYILSYAVYLPIQNLVKMVSSKSSVTVSPVISPIAFNAAVRSMVTISSGSFSATDALASARCRDALCSASLGRAGRTYWLLPAQFYRRAGRLIHYQFASMARWRRRRTERSQPARWLFCCAP